MKKSLLSFVAAAAFISGGALAAAETSTTTTTTWTDEQGNMIREYSTTKHYNSVNDTKIEARVGTELPSTITLYPLPETVRVTEPDRYNYVIINDRPVVVERRTRRVVHVWEH